MSWEEVHLQTWLQCPVRGQVLVVYCGCVCVKCKGKEGKSCTRASKISRILSPPNVEDPPKKGFRIEEDDTLDGLAGMLKGVARAPPVAGLMKPPCC